MAALKVADKTSLNGLFGTRVSFDRMERTLYGHDIAEIPGLIKPLVGSTVPDAVVQPASEEELVALVRWALGAGKPHSPITPRGREQK
jgi:FAD/FMN-containing dehydrogenase